jgi:hypothetical protein
MLISCLDPTTLKNAQVSFENVLPQIQRNLRYHFRHWHRQLRTEALDDALAACWHAWIGIVRRGQDPIAAGITGICFNASRYVKAGRRLGCGPRGRAHLDILDRRTQGRFGLQVISVCRDGRWNGGATRDAWRDCLVEDHRAGPAETAAIRIDMADWLDQLPTRKRQVAEILAIGETTSATARVLGVTPAAVSQARVWLHENWQSFQAQ